MPFRRAEDGRAVLTSFRVGRRRVIATAHEALQRWSVQQGILPRAEGGTQRPPGERLAGLMADPACHLPLSELDAQSLLALRSRRLAELKDWSAMLVEQAAMAAAIDALRELHGPHWPNPLLQSAPDGVSLICLAKLDGIRQRMCCLGSRQLLAIDIALASGARFTELDGLSRSAFGSAQGWLSLPGRRVQLPEPLAARLAPCIGIADLAAELGLEESSVRLTALTRRLAAGSHLDEAFLLAGCVDAGTPAPLVPWFG
jgi:hypothetical protein